MSLDERVPIDNRPSDYEYALISQHLYDEKIKKGDIFVTEDGEYKRNWKIHQVRQGKWDYFGAIYIDDETKQIVQGHRGTPSLLSTAMLENIFGVWLNQPSPQKEEVFEFVTKAINLVKSKEGYQLSFTGHSLGAYLAVLSVFYAHKDHDYFNVNAVTFESPGLVETIEKMNTNVVDERIALSESDIVNYVSYPNRINTCNKHVGTLYHIKPKVGKSAQILLLHLKQVHSMQRMIEAFKQGVEKKYMLDWPLRSDQLNEYFNKAEFDEDDGVYYVNEEPTFQLTYEAHYETGENLGSWQVLPLRHFSPIMQKFLDDFYDKIKYKSNEKRDLAKKLEEIARDGEIPKLIKYLQNYKVIDGRSKKIMLINELKDVKVTDFRKELSILLNKSSYSVHQLMDLLLLEGNNNSSQDSPNVSISNIAPGCRVKKGATVERNKASLMDLKLLDRANNQENINNIQQCSKIVQEISNNKKIRICNLPENADVSGTVRDNVATCLSCKFTERSEKSDKDIKDNLDVRENENQQNTLHQQSSQEMPSELENVTKFIDASESNSGSQIKMYLSSISPGAQANDNFQNNQVIGIKNIYNITQTSKPSPATKWPEAWKVPPQVTQPLQIFVNRNQEKKDLNDFFERRKTCCVLISAIGGQGKTVLAKKFIQEITARNRSFPPTVNWLNGETMQTLVNGISDYMKEIGLPIVNTNNQSISTASMIDSLSHFAHKTTNGSWIVVIDNTDGFYPEFEDIVDKFVQCGSFLIITSRQVGIIRKEAEYIPLQGLELDAVSSLVKELLPETNGTDNIFQLCKELQGYPLGIRQAIAYIKFQQRECLLGSKYGVNNFLDDLRKASAKVVSQNMLRDYPQSVLNIMEMALEKIKSKENGVDAIKVLKVLSLVNADGVTIDYLGRLVGNCTKMEDIKPLLILLKSICFVEVSTSKEQSISIHRVFQTIVRDKMKAEKETEQLLDKLLGCHDEYLIWSLDRNQILHLMQIWEHSFEYCNLVKGHSDMATDIFNKLLSLTLYQELRRFAKRISSVLRRISGVKERDILWMEYYQFLGLETSSEYQEALKQYKILYEKQVKHLGQYDSHTLLTQQQIASTLCNMKKWEESLTKHQEVYSLMLKHLPKDHPHTRITQHNIAICLKEMGELDKALLQFRDVYKFRKKEYGPTSSWTLNTKSHIADIWFQKMDFEKARLVYEKVYVVSKSREGELHENTIRAMEMLARSLWELGQKQEGYGKLSEKAKLYEKELGLKHRTTIMIQDLLKGWASQMNL